MHVFNQQTEGANSRWHLIACFFFCLVRGAMLRCPLIVRFLLFESECNVVLAPYCLQKL
jgi:hypothetical protein